MVGYDDDGYLIASVARSHAPRKLWRAYQERQAAATAERPRLTVVQDDA